ncbi:unnamed protein product [Closterium sp. NIES-54]
MASASAVSVSCGIRLNPSTFQKPLVVLASKTAFIPSPLPLTAYASCSKNVSSRVATRCSASIHAAMAVSPSELDVISRSSEIVPDSIVGGQFESFKPTAATVSSSLILGVSSLGEAKFDGAIKSALAYGKCMIAAEENKFSCFLDKALVNVGRELSLEVSGRVSTEVDPRLAHNTAAMVDRVRNLAELYKEVDVGVNRVLFKLPATWEGIEAARQLEAEGIKTHVTGVASFAQASACAQANVAVIQIPVGRIKDWARTHSGDKEVEAAAAKGEDPGVSLVRRACAFIARNNFPTKVMASNIRSKEDALSLHGTDYLVVPLKVMEALKDTPASPDLKPAAVSAAADKVKPWDMARFMANIGPCARQLLQAEIDSAVSQAEKRYSVCNGAGASQSRSLKPIAAAAGHSSAFTSRGNKEGKEGGEGEEGFWEENKSNGAGDSPIAGVREGEGEGVGKGEQVSEEEMGESVAAARGRVRHELYAPIEPYRSGTLAVSDVHTVYWEESGNPKGQPVIFLHGGPGGGTSPANRRFFDPTFFRIVLLDQRGAGRSTPHACLEENTTWHLVEDIETLRKHLGVDKWLVFGGSWGSTLSLVYAATHPDRVAGLILRGIFLLRRKEVEWFYQKGADSIFPDAFDKYSEFIPKEEQHNH